MTPGAKVFLTLASLGVVGGVLALAASKKASAAPLPKPDEGTVVVPPHDGIPPAVVPPEPESGFDRSSPFAVPGIQDAQEASRILLRWWASEGQSLVAGDTADDRPNAPADFGSQAVDLNGEFGARTRAVAAAFEHYNGLTPEDGALSNPLLLALRRWEQSQQLSLEPLPPAQAPLPPVLPPVVLPAPSSGPPVVPLPPIAPQAPVVPVPPLLPPLSQPGPEAPAPAVPVVIAPPATPPGPLPVPPVAVPTPAPSVPVIAPPEAAEAPPATTVRSDTAQMVNALLLAEGRDGWNDVDPAVQAWQSPRGLVVDGKFGPKSALTVAEEFGTVPIIRFWPKGSQKAKALQDYRAALVALANQATDSTRAAQLRVSAQREQGQSFGVTQGKAPALPSSLRVALAKVA